MRSLRLAGDGGERRAERANLEDPLARSLLLGRNLLARRHGSLAWKTRVDAENVRA